MHHPAEGRSRPSRFSLRALLIAITVLGLLAALFAQNQHMIRLERKLQLIKAREETRIYALEQWQESRDMIEVLHGKLARIKSTVRGSGLIDRLEYQIKRFEDRQEHLEQRLINELPQTDPASQPTAQTADQ